MDLVFIFSPANRLKREFHRVGDAIYKGSLNKLPMGLRQSVMSFYFFFIKNRFQKDFWNIIFQLDQFSIYLLHQKKSFNVGGFFELDNNFFYSVSDWVWEILSHIMFVSWFDFRCWAPWFRMWYFSCNSKVWRINQQIDKYYSSFFMWRLKMYNKKTCFSDILILLSFKLFFIE